MSVSRETSDADAVYSMWLLTRDPVKVAQESFYHEAHRVAMQAHEQRKRGLDGEIRSQPPKRGRPSYAELRDRLLSYR